MFNCFFASDLHGRTQRYEKLFAQIASEKPQAVFLGGDLLPLNAASFSRSNTPHESFIDSLLVPGFNELEAALGNDYPRIFIILGNDDARSEKSAILRAADSGLWEYIHNQHAAMGKWLIFGYSFVPPTPFLLKDWERYDVSRYVDPGCIPPEYGHHTVPFSENEIKHSTIQKDLEKLADNNDLTNAIFLFHSPPYQTKLDRAALDGQTIDHVPLDVHVGSVAIKRFIESRQPLLTLHGHVHEAARLTGSWREKIGRTHIFSAAHDGPELALVKFDLDNLDNAGRLLI